MRARAKEAPCCLKLPRATRMLSQHAMLTSVLANWDHMVTFLEENGPLHRVLREAVAQPGARNQWLLSARSFLGRRVSSERCKRAVAILHPLVQCCRRLAQQHRHIGFLYFDKKVLLRDLNAALTQWDFQDRSLPVGGSDHRRVAEPGVCSQISK